jgi:hypothetical protein
MALRDLTDSHAVEMAIQEFDELGRDAFLEKYGFGPSRAYLIRVNGNDYIRVNGNDYDSRAIAGVAQGTSSPISARWLPRTHGWNWRARGCPQAPRSDPRPGRP